MVAWKYQDIGGYLGERQISFKQIQSSPAGNGHEAFA